MLQNSGGFLERSKLVLSSEVILLEKLGLVNKQYGKSWGVVYPQYGMEPQCGMMTVPLGECQKLCKL